jgi:hypothetical protein
VKSTEEHRALQLLDQAGDYANRAETLTVVDDREVNLIRAVVGCGLSMLAVAEEIRELRTFQFERFPAQPIIVKSCECYSANLPNRPIASIEALPDRSARGHLAVAFLAMAGTIVLLLVLCVVLALT